NRLQQVRRSSIMQEEKPLPQPPQRAGPYLSGARLSLRDPIGEPRAHVVDQEIGEEIHGFIAYCGDGSIACIERGRMTERAAGTAEQSSPSSNGLGPPWPIGRRHRC